MIEKINNVVIQNEVTTILAGASQISRDNQLKEVCTEALLSALIENEAVAAKLLNTGFNIFMFKRLLSEKLKTKSIDSPPVNPPYSVALEGLLALYVIDCRGNASSLQLLKTIIRNNNTAAARLLSLERITLTENNHLIYTPILN
ncbi:MAG: hypothetical protein M3O71_02510 [Bacteroidota bacterium]|nr:hypothetical protein [Bacteroidota bacterium]